MDHPTPVLLPGKSHGRRSLVDCSPWGGQESDTTERLHFHFSLSCIGERNGNPLQCSCLENPRDGEPGGLLSLGSHRVGHDWSDLAALMNGLSILWATEAWAHWGPSEKPATETSNQAKESVHLLVSFCFEDSSARLINSPIPLGNASLQPNRIRRGMLVLEV